MLPPQNATKFSCTCCSWTKTVKPLSDVRHEGIDNFEKCPKCQAAVTKEYLDNSSAGMTGSSIWSTVKQLFATSNQRTPK